MLILPAIDLLNGKVVRLSKGKFDNITAYNNSLFEQIKLYIEYGFKWIHIVDLSGSKEGKFTAVKMIEEIKKKNNIKIEFGGGVRTSDDVETLFNSGIDLAIIGSLAVANRNELEKIISKHGPEKLIIAADTMDGLVRIKGWTENSGISVFDHIKYCNGLGIKKFLCTDIETDGMLTGPNFKLYSEITAKFPAVDLIASGGVSKIGDVYKLNEMNIYGAVIGKAIYEGIINLKELAQIGK